MNKKLPCSQDSRAISGGASASCLMGSPSQLMCQGLPILQLPSFPPKQVSADQGWEGSRLLELAHLCISTIQLGAWHGVSASCHLGNEYLQLLWRFRAAWAGGLEGARAIDLVRWVSAVRGESSIRGSTKVHGTLFTVWRHLRQNFGQFAWLCPICLCVPSTIYWCGRVVCSVNIYYINK